MAVFGWFVHLIGADLSPRLQKGTHAVMSVSFLLLGIGWSGPAVTLLRRKLHRANPD